MSSTKENVVVRSQKDRGDDMRFLLHDLATLVATTSAITQAMLETGELQLTDCRWLGALVKECQRGRLLLQSANDELPTFASTSRLDLIVNEVAESLSVAYGVQFRIDSEPVEVPIDETIIWRVVVNIFDNARRAAGGDPVDVVVRLDSESRRAILWLRNPVGATYNPAFVEQTGLGQIVVASFLRRQGGTWTFLDSEIGAVTQEVCLPAVT